MALTQPALFLYGYQVTIQNSSLEFYNSNTQTPLTALQATLTEGYYSLTGLLLEIATALSTADPSNTYLATANRSLMGGLENRVTISSSGSFFSIIFGTGLRASSSCATLIGFNHVDYTGATTYTGSSTTGKSLQTIFPAYNYLPPELMQKIFGSVNISANGDKEAIVYQIQKFWQASFKYEPKAKVLTQWNDFFTWAIQQRPLEFTPEYNVPGVFLEGTLEKTPYDGKALGFSLPEMLPSFPNFYETGMLNFRLKIQPPTFLL